MVTPEVSPAPAPAVAPTPADLQDLLFTTPARGLAAIGVHITGVSMIGGGGLFAQDSGGIARTDDGGAHWVRTWTSPGTGVGWIGPAGNQLYAAGTVWPTTPTSTTVGAPLVLDSSDDGLTWAAGPAVVPESAAQYWPTMRFAFGSRAVGLGVLNPDLTWDEGQPAVPGVLRTVDGGRHWTSVALPGGARPSGGVAFSSPSRALITAESPCGGEVLASSDGGASWVPVATCEPFSVWVLDFVDQRHGFAAGGGFGKYSSDPDRAVLATTDGGATWRTRYLSHDAPQEASNGFTMLRFGDVTHGMSMTGACTNGQNWPCSGLLFTTTDGGATWQAANQRGSVLSVSGSDGAWVAAAEDGAVQSTTDRGATWQAQTVPWAGG